MKIKEGFVLRKVSDENVVVAVGSASSLLNGIIKLNSSGVLLWNRLLDGAGKEELADCLMQNYGIEEERAVRDVEAFLQPLIHVGCIEEL